MRVNKSDNLISKEIPDDAFEALARCLLPAIVAYYDSDAGKREFAEWQKCEDIENLSGIKIKSENIRLAG